MILPRKLLRKLSIVLVSFMSLQPVLMMVAYSQDQDARSEAITLAEGTEISLVTTKDVTSKLAKPGDAVSFKVDEDVVVNGHVLISKGTPAVGSVINAEKSARMGKSGKLGIQVESTTTADGQPLRLRAAKGKEGKDKTNNVAALSILVSSFFLLKKGEDATIKTGTPVKVYVDEEKRFRVSGASVVADKGAVETEKSASVDNAGGAGSAGTEDMATVYIYRPSKLVGKALEPSVFCDGVELGRMDNGRYLTLKLKPGKHLIHMTEKKKGYDINMGRGQVYYFRVGIEMGMWKGQGKLLLDDKEKGEAEVKKLKFLGDEKIKDKTMVAVEKSGS